MQLLGRIAILTGTVLVLLYFAARNGPVYNWDMVGYVAAAHHRDGLRGQELLDRTYGDVRREVSKENYSELVGGRYAAYRQVVATDSAALEQQVPFYSIRVAYIEAMRLFKRTGMEYPAATYRISIVFAALSVLVLGMICLQQRVPLIAVSFVTLGSGYVQLVSLSSPDAMACFFGLLATWALLGGRKVGFVLAALLPLVRTDYVILSLLLMMYSFWQDKWQRPAAVVTALAALTVSTLINNLHGHYGWLTVLSFTFLELSPYPADMKLSFNLMDYVQIYISAATELLTHPHLLLYFLALFLLAANWRSVGTQAPLFLLLLIPLMFLAVRLTLFPLLQARFFVYPTSLVLIWLLSQLKPAHAPSTSMSGA